MLGWLDLGHGRGLHKVQVPQQPHPHDARHDVQPAYKEPPPSSIKPDELPAQHADQDDDDNQENDARCERPVQVLKKGCHDIASPLQIPSIG